MTVPSIVLRVPEIVADVLGLPSSPTTAQSLRDDLGADSIDLVELAMAIEEDFRLDIVDTDADEWKTVGDVIAYVEKATASS